MTYYEEWKEDLAKAPFARMRHKRVKYGTEFDVIEWRDPEKEEPYMRILFDVCAGSCTVTGELCNAVISSVQWRNITPERFASEIRTEDLRDLDLYTTCDRRKYTWSRAKFKEDCAFELGQENWDVVCSMAERFSETAETPYQDFKLSREEEELLQHIDDEFDGWFWHLGRGYSLVLYSIALGVRLAVETGDVK